MQAAVAVGIAKPKASTAKVYRLVDQEQRERLWTDGSARVPVSSLERYLAAARRR